MKLTDVTEIVSSTDVKLILDTLSIGALLGTMVNVLPHIATGLTVIWITMRIGETIYGWFKKKPVEHKD